jgi:hypothetical protein
MVSLAGNPGESVVRLGRPQSWQRCRRAWSRASVCIASKVSGRSGAAASSQNQLIWSEQPSKSPVSCRTFPTPACGPPSHCARVLDSRAEFPYRATRPLPPGCPATLGTHLRACPGSRTNLSCRNNRRNQWPFTGLFPHPLSVVIQCCPSAHLPGCHQNGRASPRRGMCLRRRAVSPPTHFLAIRLVDNDGARLRNGFGSVSVVVRVQK